MNFRQCLFQHFDPGDYQLSPFPNICTGSPPLVQTDFTPSETLQTFSLLVDYNSWWGIPKNQIPRNYPIFSEVLLIPKKLTTRILVVCKLCIQLLEKD